MLPTTAAFEIVAFGAGILLHREKIIRNLELRGRLFESDVRRVTIPLFGKQLRGSVIRTNAAANQRLIFKFIEDSMFLKRTAVFAILLVTSTEALAGDYPISGAWASAWPDDTAPAKSCESFSKSPQSPAGNVILFQGNVKTEFNGGYLEKEVVKNFSVKEVGKNEFLVTDSYYDDGEGGGRPGKKRRSYKLKFLDLNKVEIVEKGSPKLLLTKCSLTPKAAQLTVTGPAFDCAKARLQDELAICHDIKLSELDRIVVASYTEVRRVFGSSFDQKVRALLVARNSCQSDKACILERQDEAIRFYNHLGIAVSTPKWVAEYKIALNSGAANESPPSASSGQSQAQSGEKPLAATVVQREKGVEPKAVSRSNDKARESILFIYQQYLVLKNCEANAPGLIKLDSIREKLKKFDQSIRSKGYDPDQLFADSKNVPFPESLKILLVSISMLPMAQGSNQAQLLSVCRSLAASEDKLLDMALTTPEQETSKQEKIMEKDF